MKDLIEQPEISNQLLGLTNDKITLPQGEGKFTRSATRAVLVSEFRKLNRDFIHHRALELVRRGYEMLVSALHVCLGDSTCITKPGCTTFCEGVLSWVLPTFISNCN